MLIVAAVAGVYREYVQKVELVIIDEIHLLGVDRGAVLVRFLHDMHILYILLHFTLLCVLWV